MLILSVLYTGLKLVNKKPASELWLNQVDLGGIIFPASAMDIKSSIVVGYMESNLHAFIHPLLQFPRPLILL